MWHYAKAIQSLGKWIDQDSIENNWRKIWKVSVVRAKSAIAISCIFSSLTKLFIYSLHSATHSILANSKDLHIPENQRIYVTGVLQLKSDRTIDGTFVKVGIVRSFQTSLITNSCLDLNMIELKAPVASDVVDEEEFSMFVVATHSYWL